MYFNQQWKLFFWQEHPLNNSQPAFRSYFQMLKIVFFLSFCMFLLKKREISAFMALWPRKRLQKQALAGQNTQQVRQKSLRTCCSKQQVQNNIFQFFKINSQENLLQNVSNCARKNTIVIAKRGSFLELAHKTIKQKKSWRQFCLKIAICFARKEKSVCLLQMYFLSYPRKPIYFY